jgi:DNA-binding transcriptional LysR family regulator
MRSHLNEVLHRSDSAMREARSFLSLEAASLTLGVMCTIGPVRFIGFLNAFRDRHPGIEITLIEGAADHLNDLLLSGELDVALLARPEPFDHRLATVPVYAERFGLAFSSGHRFESRNTLQLTDVQGEAVPRTQPHRRAVHGSRI